MTEPTTTIRVRVDAGEALRDVQAMTRTTSAVTASMGNALGLGGAFGEAERAATDPVRGAFGAAFSEATLPWRTQIEQWALGSLGQESRGRESARDDTIAKFGYTAGLGRIPDAAADHFNQLAALRTTAEKGRSLFEGNSAFTGQGMEKLAKQLFEGVGGLVSDALRLLGELLVGHSGVRTMASVVSNPTLGGGLGFQVGRAIRRNNGW